MEETKNRRKLTLLGRFKSVHGLVEMGLLIAMAVVLDLDIFKLNLGLNQSISLTMLPLFIIALRYNAFESFLGIGLIYGFITVITDGSNIISFPFDYLLAYGALSLISLTKKYVFKDELLYPVRLGMLIVSIAVAVSVRVFWSTISGIIIYESPSLIASFTYNAPAMYVSGAISLAGLLLLFPAIVLLNKKLELTK